MLRDLFFPKKCVGCIRLGIYICNTCRVKLEPIETQMCFYCKRRSAHGLTHPICRRTYGADAFICIYKYSAFLRQVLKTVKYRMAKEALQELLTASGALIQSKLTVVKQIYPQLVVSPLPLHRSREAQRGFNQAFLVSQHIALQSAIPHSSFLVRARATKPQSQLKNKNLRYLNVRGAFKPIDGQLIRNKQILIVDDVVTTGSTIGEAVRTLKKNEAAQVIVFALAKA